MLQIDHLKHVHKFFRYVGYYGLVRTLFKAYGRSESLLLFIVLRLFVFIVGSTLNRNRSSKIGLIGCGQYGFSTIGYFLVRQGYVITHVYDVDKTQCRKFERIFKSRILMPHQMVDCDRIYIASNHASHAVYASNFVLSNKWVHIEKPIAVDYESLSMLEPFIGTFNGSVGYNRPHSRYTRNVLKILKKNLPISLSFNVVGHNLRPDHWYNNPNEGTRLLGNFSHWIDLTLFLFNHINDRSSLSLCLSLLDDGVIDDNILVDIKSELGSRSTILFQTRSEPILGIQESHFYQQEGETIFIRDYRSIEIISEKYSKRIRTRKDVGHLDMLKIGRSNHSDFERAIETTKLTLAIIDGLRSGAEKISFKRYATNHTKFK